MGLSDVGVGQSVDCYVDFFTGGWYNLINSIDGEVYEIVAY